MIAKLTKRFYKSSPRSKKPPIYIGLEVKIGDVVLPRVSEVVATPMRSGLTHLAVDFAVTEVVHLETTTVGEPKRRKRN